MFTEIRAGGPTACPAPCRVNGALTLLTLCLALASLAFSLPARAADTITFDNLPHEPGFYSSSTFAAANGGSSTYDGVTFDTTSLVFGDQSRLGKVHSPHYALLQKSEIPSPPQPLYAGLLAVYPIVLTTNKALTSFYVAPSSRAYGSGHVYAMQGSKIVAGVNFSFGSTPQLVRTGFEKLIGITGYALSSASQPGVTYSDEALAVDDLTFAASYEAENGTLAGRAVAFSDSGASNGKAVGVLWIPGASDTLTNVDGGSGGTQNLIITYGVSGNAVHDIVVNGVDLGPITFPSTGGYTSASYQTLTVPITLNPGTTNTVQLYTTRADAVASGYNGIVADKFTVAPPIPPTTIEAENGTLAGGAVAFSDTAASNGKAVGVLWIPGASDTLTGVDGSGGGTQNLIITYGVSGSAVHDIVVNGVDLGPITFPSTGGYTSASYQSLTVPITLNPGTSNTIELFTTRADAVASGYNGIVADKFTIQ